MVGAEDVPALAYFSPERLLLTSQCGFGYVPLDGTHEKLRILVATCRELRSFRRS
jgi:5-methyltetrahydropteroyltriglutamate--homocysteine methyltransferase